MKNILNFKIIKIWNNVSKSLDYINIYEYIITTQFIILYIIFYNMLIYFSFLSANKD